MIHANGSAFALAVARIAVFGVYLGILVTTPIHQFADLPIELYQTLGILRYAPAALTELGGNRSFLLGLRVFLVAGCALVVLGVRPHVPVALATFGGLLLYESIDKGFSAFINHAQLGLLYAALIIAIFPAADRLSVSGRRHTPEMPGAAANYALPMVSVVAIMAMAYSLMGIARFVQGGIEVFTGDAIIVHFATKTEQYSQYGYTLTWSIFQLPGALWLLKAGFLGITIMEVTAPLALVWTLYRYLWVATMIPFHFSTLVTMNIFFWENIILIAVFFTGLPYALEKAADARRPGPPEQAGTPEVVHAR